MPRLLISILVPLVTTLALASPAHAGTVTDRLVLRLPAAVEADEGGTSRVARAALTVRWANWGREVHVTLDRAQTRRLAQAGDSGIVAFLATFCGLVPGGMRAAPVKGTCAAGVAAAYSRLNALFRRAEAQGRCARVSYPPFFPIPNPEPFSKVVAC